MQLFFAEVFIDGTALNQQLRYPCKSLSAVFFEMKSFAGGSQYQMNLIGIFQQQEKS
jgi:hypothetical protein